MFRGHSFSRVLLVQRQAEIINDVTCDVIRDAGSPAAPRHRCTIRSFAAGDTHTRDHVRQRQVELAPQIVQSFRRSRGWNHGGHRRRGVSSRGKSMPTE